MSMGSDGLRFGSGMMASGKYGFNPASELHALALQRLLPVIVFVLVSCALASDSIASTLTGDIAKQSGANSVLSVQAESAAFP